MVEKGDSIITGAEASPSDGLMSYPENSFGRGFNPLQRQSVYSTATADKGTRSWVGVLPLYRDVVGVFDSPSQLGLLI